MKKYLFGLFLIIGIYACDQSVGQTNNYGAKITEEGAITMKELVAKMETQKEVTAKVTGTILKVCQTKGCWMTIDKGDGSSMRVSFKDYGFFVPKDISGKTVVVEGKATVTTTTVEELRHFAEDAGKSKEEIAKITEGKTELTFEADGVIVK